MIQRRLGPATREPVVQPGENQSCNGAIDNSIYGPNEYVAELVCGVKPRIDGISHLEKIYTVVWIHEIDQTDQ